VSLSRSYEADFSVKTETPASVATRRSRRPSGPWHPKGQGLRSPPGTAAFDLVHTRALGNGIVVATYES
jgi:hypothetical protein